MTGTRLRLREVIKNDGTMVRKLAHKIRLNEGPAEVACTNFHLNDQEWAVVGALPAKVLRKKRHVVHRDGLIVAIDEHEDGTLIAEIDDGDMATDLTPDWLDVIEDVSDDERWTGALPGLEDHLAEVLPRSCVILGVGFLLRGRHPRLGE